MLVLSGESRDLSEIVGLHGNALKVKVAAPPVDGKANAALESFLAGVVGVPPSSASVVRGQTNRRKVVRLTGVSMPAAVAALRVP